MFCEVKAVYLPQIMRIMKPYIYQKSNWPDFKWDNEAIINLLSRVRHLQGKVIGKMESLGFDLRNEAVLETLTIDVIKSSEIEGLVLNPEQVRSSIARRLGMDVSGLVESDRHVDGVVDMLLDATQQSGKPLSAERLFGWHSSLFPAGRSGMYKIIAGSWRDDSTGPMQVVSGAMGKEKVHYEAPPAKDLETEMDTFLNWFNNNNDYDLLIKAGIAHLWFVTLHPFEDGNGRIARAIADMLLAKSDGVSQRFYSMSAQIRVERKPYYEILERTQKGSMDVTEWLTWFLRCLENALVSSGQILAHIMNRQQFWVNNSKQIFNDRQVLMLNKMLEGFTGKLTTSKWAKITGCSADTALRDINDLIEKQVLQKESAGGRSTNYALMENNSLTGTRSQI